MKLKTFHSENLGIRGVVPEGWAERRPGEVARGASPIDPTALFQQGFAGMSIKDLKEGLIPHLGIDAFPEQVGTRETDKSHLGYCKGLGAVIRDGHRG